MCGIGGILRVWSPQQRAEALATPPVRAIPEAWLDVIDDAVKHRGPDGRGRFRDRLLRPDGSVVDVALVHRRLSILDHAGGHQPMLSLGKGRGVVTGTRRLVLGEGLGLYERNAASELAGGGSTAAERIDHGVAGGTESGDGAGEPGEGGGGAGALSDRVCVVFNGCIYNHRELRAELQAAGHVFTTDHSDTEVLVHGWREWGAGLTNHLDGMYAIVLWDYERGRAVAMRDWAGEKPLFATDISNEALPDTLPSCGRSGVLAWTSTVAGGVRLASAIDGGARCVERLKLWEWIQFGCAAHPPTRTTRTIGTGEVVLWGPDFPTIGSTVYRRRPPDRQSKAHLTPELVGNLLERSVRSRLDADVPLGVFLSGGIDSSLVSWFAARAAARVRTFTVRMPDQRLDESPTAQRIAGIIGTDHSTLDCDPYPTDDLITLIHQIGVPFGDSSLLPTAWVSRAAREHVKVALTGDGGDELFLGYRRHCVAKWLDLVRRLAPDVPPELLWSTRPQSRKEMIGRMLQAAAGQGYGELLRIFPRAEANELGSPFEHTRLCGHFVGQWPEPTHPFEPSLERDRCPLVISVSNDDPARHDFDLYLPSDLMLKSDTASMSVALESRSPLLSVELVQAALAEPLSSLMPRGQRKGLLRQVARKYLPSEIVDRPKMGFAIPIGEWFRSDYGGLRTMLLDHLNSAEPFGPPSLGIDPNMAYVRQMLDEHLGTGPSGLVKRDHSQRLYMLLVLSIWAKWLGGLR